MLLVAGGAVAVVHTLAIVAFCWFAATSLAAVIAGEPLDALAGPVIATAISILVRALSQAALDALAMRGAARVKSQLRAAALDALDRGGARALETRSSARLSVLLGQGLDAMDGYIGKYLPQLVLTVVATPLIVGVLALADRTTGIAVIVTLPLIPVFMILIGVATQAMQQRQWAALGTLAQGFHEVVSGLATLTIFGRQHRQEARIRDVTEQYRRRTMRVLRLSFLSGFALELAASLSVAVVAVSIGIRLIDGDIALALGLFVLMLVPEAYLPLRQVGAQYHAAAEGIAAANDVLDVLAEPEPEAVALGVIEARTDAPALEACGVTIERDGAPVVQRLELQVCPGEIVAITGPSGAGKSTLVAGILDFVPLTEGSIAVGGSSVARRDRVAWVPQRASLIGASVGEAVAFGDSVVDPHRVQAALRLAACDLDPATPLEVAGRGLSGGQTHRVAIARAIYRALRLQSALVVLDEPTAALDARTESRVMNGLAELAAAGFGILVVSHREAVADRADRTVVVEPRRAELGA